jgi:hypothetical protein
MEAASLDCVTGSKQAFVRCEVLSGATNAEPAQASRAAD